MSRQHPQFLLLQARVAGDPMGAHEHQCFVDTLGVTPERVLSHDLLVAPPTAEDLRGADALLVGGSGEFSVLDDVPSLHAFFDFLTNVVIAQGFPTFASCFGFQALVVAGGGKVVLDKANTEVGTFRVDVNEAGQGDSLMAPLAPTFQAQLGHKDRADRLPAGMVNLAHSERAPYQALRVDGLPVFATQFHPELNKDTNRARYLRYWDEYGGGDPDDDPVLKSLDDSPEASALLPRWVQGELLPLL